MLLNQFELKKSLEADIIGSSRSWIYSAYITEDSCNWLLSLRSPHQDDRILVRCRPADVLSGGCSLVGLEALLKAGYLVRISSALHVKLYFFDSHYYVGSSNFTSAGISLFGRVNDELNVRVTPSKNDILIAQNLWVQGVELDIDKLYKMKALVESVKKAPSANIRLSWPENILREDRDMYCSDWPVGDYEEDERWQSYEALRTSVAYTWLVSLVTENERGVSFGAITAELHSQLYDDPLPYRSEIKTMVANMLQLVSNLDTKVLKVSRPRHSQVVDLVERNNE